MSIDIVRLGEIVEEAKAAAKAAAQKYFEVHLNGEDQYSCGFAWVCITTYDGKRITGNTKMGRALKKVGVGQNYDRTFYIWNPAAMPVQNVDTLTVGAVAAAEVFKKYGFGAYAGFRLD